MAKSLQDIFQDIQNGQLVDAKDFIKALKDEGYLNTGRSGMGNVKLGDVEEIRKLLAESRKIEGQSPKLLFGELRKDIADINAAKEDLAMAKEDLNKSMKKFQDETKFTNIEDAIEKIKSLEGEVEKLKGEFKDMAMSSGVSEDQLDALEDMLASNKSLAEIQATFPDLQQDIIDKYKEINDAEGEEAKLAGKTKEVLQDTNQVLREQNNLQREASANIKKGWDKMSKAAMGVVDAWGKIDQAAAKAAKSIGSSAANMASMRKNAINTVVQGSFAAKYGVDASDLIGLEANYQNTIGRRVNMSAQDQESMAALNPVMGEEGADMVAKFENFGLSVTDAGKAATKMFKDAGKYGLSFQKYSDNFVKNLSMAQNYTFKNGVKGLESMAKKATAIKLDMSQIAAFADKVTENGVEGAVETGAQLQVLGGPFAAMSDPLGMLNEGLNDVEGLMDRFKSMTAGLARFDANTGEVNVSSFNKQRIKAAAQAMGMDYSQVMESVQAQGKQTFIEKQIAGKGYSDQQREFLKNTANVSGGSATISWYDDNGKLQTKDVNKDNITAEDWKQIESQNQTEGENISDIAQLLRGWDDIMTGGKKQLDTNKANIGEKTVMPAAKNAAKKVIDNPTIMKSWAALSVAIPILTGTILATNGILTWTNVQLGKMHGPNVGGGTGLGGKLKGLGGKIKGAAGKVGGKLKGLGSGLKDVSSFGGKAAGTLGKAKGAAAVGKSALKGAGTLGKFAKSNAITGAIVSGVFTGIDEFTNKKNKHHSTAKKIGKTAGSAVGGGLGGWGGAAAGAALGTAIAPGLGTVIGGLIGGAVGAFSGEKAGKFLGGGLSNDKRRDKFREKFGLTGLSGDYSVEELRKINKGDIDEKLQKKIDKNNDNEIVVAKSQEVNEQNVQKMNASALYINGKEFQTEGVAKAANGGYITGPSHANGGVPVGRTGIEVEGGEFVVNKKATKNNMGLLTAINKMGNGGVIKSHKMENGGTIAPKMENGGVIKPRQMKTGGVIPVAPVNTSSSSSNNTPSSINVAPININLSGEIKLSGKGGQSVDITDEILKDPAIIRKLTKVIEEQLAQNLKGGNITQKGLR